MKKIENLHEHVILTFLTMQRMPVGIRSISLNTNTSEKGVRSVLMRLQDKNMVVEMHDSDNEKKKLFSCTDEGKKTIDKEQLELQITVKIQDIDTDKLKTICKLLDQPGWLDIVNEALVIDSHGLFKSEEQLKHQIMRRRLRQLEKELGQVG